MLELCGMWLEKWPLSLEVIYARILICFLSTASFLCYCLFLYTVQAMFGPVVLTPYMDRNFSCNLPLWTYPFRDCSQNLSHNLKGSVFKTQS